MPEFTNDPAYDAALAQYHKDAAMSRLLTGLQIIAALVTIVFMTHQFFKKG